MRRTLIVLLVASTAFAVVPIWSAGASPTPTQLSVRRPVTTTGHLSAGFTRRDLPGSGLIDCSNDTVSPVAVNHGIFACAPSAAYAVACWHAALAHHVLCYQNPFGHVVVRYLGDAPAKATFPREQRAPLGLVLGDGNRCTIRDGGAWPSPTSHPSWVGYYSCTGTDNAVWGPLSSSYHAGINESQPVWTVHTGAYNKPLQVRRVTRAWFVGTKSS